VPQYRTRVSKGWIEVSQDEDNWHRMCWLPAERQLSEFGLGWRQSAYHGQKVCIGAMTGAVTILDLSNVLMPWAY
jgi:hypothetical protein